MKLTQTQPHTPTPTQTTLASCIANFNLIKQLRVRVLVLRNTIAISMCINAMKGKAGGDTWEKRRDFLGFVDEVPQTFKGFILGAELDGLD